MRRPFGAGRVAIITVSCLLVVVGLGVVSPGAASALSCPDNVHQNIVGGDVSGADVGDIRGFKSDLVSNDFNSAQCHTVRSIIAYKNGNNNVEIGWRKVDGDGYSHTVFYYWVNAGIWDETVTNYHPANSSWHTYWLANANGNDYWAFNYDSTYIESKYIPNMVKSTYSLANSERHDLQDSLWGHWETMRVCTALNCASYHTPDVNQVYANPTSDFEYCKINVGETIVRETC